MYAQTALGKKALAYDFWFDPAPLKGKDALFVWSSFENFSYENSDLLTRFFEKVTRLNLLPSIGENIPYERLKLFIVCATEASILKRLKLSNPKSLSEFVPGILNSSAGNYVGRVLTKGF